MLNPSGFPGLKKFRNLAAGIWDASARIQPRVSFEYELWGGAAIWSGNAINWRHKLRAPKLSRSLALEVRSAVCSSSPGHHACKLIGMAQPVGLQFHSQGSNTRNHPLRGERPVSLVWQVAGNVELPAPAARYDWQRDDAQRLSVGQGAFRLHLDQCNVVLDL